MKQNLFLLLLAILIISCETVRTGDENLPCSETKDIGIFENERDLPLEGAFDLPFFNLRGEEFILQVNKPLAQQDVPEFSLSVHFSDCFRTGDVEQLIWQQEEHRLNYIFEVISNLAVVEKIVVDSLDLDNGIIGEYFDIQSQFLGFNGGSNSSFGVMAFPINGSTFPENSKFNFGYDVFENIILNGRTFPKVFASKNLFVSTRLTRVFIAPSGELVAFETQEGETFVIDE